jgi:hypothetical protein
MDEGGERTLLQRMVTGHQEYLADEDSETA